MQGHPRWTGHGREFWQNVVHWKREWQTMPVFLWQEPHERFEKAEKYHIKMSLSSQKVSNMLPGKREGQFIILIAPERMKQQGQSRNPRCEEPTHWERPWCWERLRAGERGDRGWDGWMALSTQWTGIWANSGRYLKTEEPGVLQSMALQRVRHNLATEQQMF